MTTPINNKTDADNDKTGHELSAAPDASPFGPAPSAKPRGRKPRVRLGSPPASPPNQPPPTSVTPPPSEPEPDPYKGLMNLVGKVLREEILPSLERRQGEQVEAAVDSLYPRVKIEIQAAVNGVANDIRAQLIPVLQLVERVQAIETRLAQAPQPGVLVPQSPAQSGGTAVATQTPPKEQEPEQPKSAPLRAAAFIETVLDVLSTKALPIIQQWQDVQRGGAGAFRWAMDLKAKDPFMAAMVANQLGFQPIGPEQLAGLLAQAQVTAAGMGMGAGLRVKVDGAKMLAGLEAGGNVSHPSMPLSNPSNGAGPNPASGPFLLPGVPLPPPSGVSMSQLALRKPKNVAS